MKTITQQEFNEIVEKHTKWLTNIRIGECADFSNTDLTNVVFHPGINLSKADFSNAKLNFQIFENINFEYGNFNNCNIISCKFGNCNLSNTDFFESKFSGDFSGDKLENHFDKCDITNSDFSFADLNNILFTYSNFTESAMCNSKINSCNFEDVNLKCLDLSNSILDKKCSFAGCNFNSVILDNVNFNKTKFIKCIGNGDELKTIQTYPYDITIINNDRLQIGCQNFSINKWMSMSDNKIANLDGSIDCLSWWRYWKPIIEKMINAPIAKDL